MPSGEEVWQDTQAKTPNNAARFRNLLTGEQVTGSQGRLLAKQIFQNFPVSLLLSE
jgi:maltooligosyltrehalose synthase